MNTSTHDLSGLHFAAGLSKHSRQLGQMRKYSAEETWTRIQPDLKSCGVTRVASITPLDVLGVPSWVAVRPGGMVLQVSNGKGLSDAAARVSAAMEACELHRAEHPLPSQIWQASSRSLPNERSGGANRILRPHELPGLLPRYYDDGFAGEWILGVNLCDSQPCFAPSSAVYFLRRPGYYDTSSNGLASGNSLAEAYLHGLYEVIERDAMCAVRQNGKLLLRQRAQIIDPDSVDDPVARLILDRCHETGSEMRLFALPGAVNLPVIWAVLLDQGSGSARTSCNVGWGCHAQPHIALHRAITEAAQSRLGMIHGARDDILRKPVHAVEGPATSPVFAFFRTLKPDTSWATISKAPYLDPGQGSDIAIRRIVDALEKNGRGPVFGFDLSDPTHSFFAARILAPKLKFDKALF
ncbi:YcaO-like family protein [Ruegeria sp. EL01]|uniref:YcaO-like family protein n=1 Tax=Ruegeria sp. EL01 TaxID=2107578 RepID=UPI000EA8002E|nr:YcaO-like family protein [Ruegeria sp. EL01]